MCITCEAQLHASCVPLQPAARIPTLPASLFRPRRLVGYSNRFQGFIASISTVPAGVTLAGRRLAQDQGQWLQVGFAHMQQCSLGWD